MDRLTLTIEETAELLGISRNSAYLAVRSGQLPVLKIGRRYLVSRANLEAMLELKQPNLMTEEINGRRGNDAK